MLLPVLEKNYSEPHMLIETYHTLISSRKSMATRLTSVAFFTFLSLFWMIGSTQSAPLKLVALGDSLTAGYGLAQGQSFPAQLAEKLRLEFPDLVMVNAGVSGDTSAGGLARFDWSVPQDTDVLMVGLGGNDLLRGQPPTALYANLEAILQKAQASNMKIVLLGMRAPTNYGPAYQAAFDAVYPNLAAKYDTGLVPFLLAGVAGEKDLNQPDGIHPNSQGVEIMVRNSYRHIAQKLSEVLTTR